MTRPSASVTRLLLIADRDHRGGSRAPSPVRRYRLARLRLDGGTDPAERHAHLSRRFD